MIQGSEKSFKQEGKGMSISDSDGPQISKMEISSLILDAVGNSMMILGMIRK